jgi:integrase
MSRRTKRPNGMGSVSQRKSDGIWWARYTAGKGPDGRPVRKAIYGRSFTDVQAKLNAALREVNAGTASLERGRGKTLEAHLQDWLGTLDGKLRPSTVKRYRELMELHVIPSLGKATLTKLDPQAIDLLLAQKRRQGLSQRTCFHIRAVLRTALRRAEKHGLVTRNAAALADAPKVAKARTASLEPAQARALVESAQQEREGPIWIVALATGLRQGELLGLRWQDLDLEARRLTVSGSLQRIDGAYRLVEPKTDSSRRSLVLPQVVVRALERQQALQAADRLKAGKRWQESWGLVFTTTTGGPLNGVTVTKSFQRHLVAMDLPRVRFHDLRHSTASLLQASGSAPADLQALLGHANVQTTLGVYTHSLSAAQAALAQEMDRLLGGA